MYRCKNFIKYSGLRRPSCNNGDPCESCLHLWESVQAILSAPQETASSALERQHRQKQREFHAKNCYGTSHYCVCK